MSNDGTAATATDPLVGKTVDEAGAAIEKLMRGNAKPATATTAEPGSEGDEATATEEENGDESAEPGDSDEADGTGEAEEGDEAPEETGEPEEGVDDTPRSALEALPAKELDRKLLLPIGENGALVEVPLREALRGHLRQADYTRKTMEVAEARKGAAQVHSEYVQRRDQLDKILPVLVRQSEEAAKGRTQAEWDALFENDPHRYYGERERERQAREELALLTEKKKQIDAERQAEQQSQFIGRVQSEAVKLVEKLGLKDQASQVRVATELRTYLQSNADHPFSEQEINSIAPDHRAWLIINKAREYDKLMAAKKNLPGKTVAPVQSTKPLQPGAARPPASTATIAAKKAFAAHSKSGTVDSAAEAIMAQERARAKQRR